MPQNIHDKFAKAIFSNRNLAEAFLESYLPKEIVNELDFKTMVYQDTSFLSDNLVQTFSDMLWRIALKDGQHLHVSILLEHKSTPDQNTPFQLLEYLGNAYRKQIKEKKKPELIIPVL